MTPSDAGRLVAITHVPSPNMQRGERTYVDETEVDYGLALRQHAGYREALRRCGASVMVLDVNRTMPDCVFVEDTAIVLDEIAIMMSPGAESRRAEPSEEQTSGNGSKSREESSMTTRGYRARGSARREGR